MNLGGCLAYSGLNFTPIVSACGRLRRLKHKLDNFVKVDSMKSGCAAIYPLQTVTNLPPPVPHALPQVEPGFQRISTDNQP